MVEVETKILEVNLPHVRRMLKKYRARHIKNVFQRNTIFHNNYTRKKEYVVRIREENKKVILTIKSERHSVRGLKVRGEYETPIIDYTTALNILTTIGFKIYSVIEMRREYYKINNCSFEIIKVPTIPTYVEIEGTEKSIVKVAKKFGYSKKDFFPGIIYDYYKIKSKRLVFK